MTRRAVFHDTGDDSYDDGAGALTDFPSTSGGPPSGSAGGDLTGTYPNPTLGTGAFGTPAVALGTAAAAGSASDAVRTDATIVAFDATVPSTQAFGDAAAAGSATVAARRDHKHAMPANPFTGASAGGDLTGTYPNPTLGTSGVTAATYGDSTHVAQVAVDAKGRITSASAVAITGSGITAVPVSFYRRIAGDYTLNNVGAFAAIDSTNLNLTLAAATGDILEISLNSRYGSDAVNAFIDAATIVSGSAVNWVSGGTGLSTNFGVSGWVGLSGVANTPSSTVFYTVQAGDISGGNVTVRLMYRTSGASKTLRAGTASADALFYGIKNLLH